MIFNAIGILFVLYGLLKIAMVLSLIIIPPHIKEHLAKIEGVNLLVTGDETLAGKMYEYILLSFAIFSVIHGLTMMEIFSTNFKHFIESKTFQYSVYLILGIWSVVFYTLVLYTNVPISKKVSEYEKYKLYGYWGGILFLIVPPFMEFIEYAWPAFRRLSTRQQLVWTMVLTLVMIGVIAITFVVMKLRKKRRKEELTKITEIRKNELT